MSIYPRWAYYPTRTKPPAWAVALVGIVAASQPEIDSAKVAGLTSDKVLAMLRPGLEGIGYRVEAGKSAADRITLPVLFGEQGLARVRYEVDGVNEEHGVLLEVEAGRGARGKAAYRDLIRTSLIVDARYLALGVMQEYHHKSSGKASSCAAMTMRRTRLTRSLPAEGCNSPSRECCYSATDERLRRKRIV